MPGAGGGSARHLETRPVLGTAGGALAVTQSATTTPPMVQGPRPQAGGCWGIPYGSAAQPGRRRMLSSGHP